MTTRTIQQDVPSGDNGIDVDEATDLLAKRFADARKGLSKEADDDTSHEAAETADPVEDNEPEEEELEDEAEEETPKPGPKADLEAEVEVKIGEETKKVKVKDLTRLYGQEAALTKKSQETAAVRQAAEAAQQKYASKLDGMLERARKRMEGFKSIDFDVLAKDTNWTVEELKALKAQHKEVSDEIAFLEAEKAEADETTKKASQEKLQERAKACMEAILDEKGQFHIPKWSQETYQGLLKFAVEKGGLSPEDALAEVDPRALKILWMAQQYDLGQQARKEKLKPRTQGTPKKVERPGREESDDAQSDAETKARRRAAQTGDIDDVQELFKARIRAQRASA